MVHELIGVVFPVTLIMGLIFGTVTPPVAVQPFEVEVTIQYRSARIFVRSSVVSPFDRRVYVAAG
jgi:hypothetical protein